MRLHPATLQLFKRCTQEYILPPPYKNGPNKPVTLPAGTPILISLYGLHLDGKYFPDPKRFNPDRFLESNKHLLRKYSYLPFGGGHRACLG